MARARHELDVLTGAGHIAVSWLPDDEREVADARREFNRLSAAGYAFFVIDADNIATRVDMFDPRASSLQARSVRRSRRSIAIPRMAGG